MGQRRPIGALEQEVLAVLAASGQALSPAEVRAALGGDLAYTTVLTALVRLHEKESITRQRLGRGYSYRWADSATVTARRMRRLLDEDADRSAALARFVADLGRDDEDLLATLLGDTHPAEER